MTNPTPNDIIPPDGLNKDGTPNLNPIPGTGNYGVQDLLNGVNPLTGIGEALGNKEFWVRFGIGAAGVGIIITGIVLLVGGNKTVVGAVKTAATISDPAALATSAGAAISKAAS